MINIVFGSIVVYIALYIMLVVKYPRFRPVALIGIYITSLIGIVGFYNIQRINGNPDVGREWTQLYMPISFVLLLTIMAFVIDHKLKKSNE